MDIKQTDNKCDLKCTFNFNYPETSIQSFLARNNIYLRFGIPSVIPVKFNEEEYTPIRANIIYPSETTYNGVRADAEFQITHSSNLQKNLIVRIPISVSSITKPSTLDDIIVQTAALLPKTAYTNLNIRSFTLEDYVPKGPFYYSETNNGYEIYYGLENSLFISEETITKLKQIIVEYKFPSLSSSLSELFYNQSGSNLSINGGDDFNFLECEQYYEEEIPIEGNDIPNMFSKMASNPWIVYTVIYGSSIIFIVLLLYILYTALSSSV